MDQLGSVDQLGSFDRLGSSVSRAEVSPSCSLPMGVHPLCVGGGAEGRKGKGFPSTDQEAPPCTPESGLPPPPLLFHCHGQQDDERSQSATPTGRGPARRHCQAGAAVGPAV